MEKSNENDTWARAYWLKGRNTHENFFRILLLLHSFMSLWPCMCSVQTTKLDLSHVSYFSHDAVLGSFAVILYGRKSRPNYNIPEILQKKVKKTRLVWKAPLTNPDSLIATQPSWALPGNSSYGGLTVIFVNLSSKFLEIVPCMSSPG